MQYILWGRQLIVVKRYVVMANIMYTYSDGEGKNNMIVQTSTENYNVPC